VIDRCCLLIVLLSACGEPPPPMHDAGPELTCGEGTVLVGGLLDGVCELVDAALPCRAGELYDERTGECLVDSRCPEGQLWNGLECEADVRCGPGTEPDGRDCVPTGERCADGTRFDSDLRRCVFDEMACGEDTVFLEGRCVPYDDTLEADHEEASEDNDPTLGGAALDLGLIAPGSTVTMRGCIEPRGLDVDGDGAPEPDRDGFRFEVDAPRVVHLRVDGVGGASGAFELYADALDPEAWRRAAISVTGDVAARDVYLPEAGTYLLLVSDARSILHGADVGGPDACYFASLEDGPAATERAWDGSASAGSFGAVEALRWIAPSDGPHVLTLRTHGMNASGALVVTRAGVVHRTAQGPSLTIDLGALSAGESLLVVPELEHRYSVDPAEYELE